MPLHRYVHTLLHVPDATDQGVVGGAFAIVPISTDQVNDQEQEFVAFYDLTKAGGGVGAEADLVIETSHDGVSWFQTSSIGSALSVDGEKHDLRPLWDLGPFLRAISLVSGEPLPMHTARVVIGSTAPFRLQAVS